MTQVTQHSMLQPVTALLHLASGSDLHPAADPLVRIYAVIQGPCSLLQPRLQS